MRNTATHLQAIRALISTPATWTQGAFARTADNVACPAVHDAAVRWCLAGAVYRVIVDPDSGDNFLAHQRASGAIKAALTILHPGFIGGYMTFNDDDMHQHADVLQVLDQAIRIARADGDN